MKKCLNIIYVPKPIRIDFTIFKLFDLCPIIIPSVPLIIINKNSKNIVIINTIIKLETELLKNIADCFRDSFNIIQVSSFRVAIARQTIITINEVNNVITAVKILTDRFYFYLQGSVCVK